jgi:hypothetical protein
MNYNVAIEPNVLIPTNYLVAAIYDPTALTVPLQIVPLSKPYDSTKTITFTDLETKVYVFRLYESVDTSPSGIIHCEFSFQPSASTMKVKSPIYITADISQSYVDGVLTTFASGQGSYSDDSLSGWMPNALIERVGIGTMFPVSDFTYTDTSWTLAISGDIVGSGEKFVMTFTPIIQPLSVSNSKLISEIDIITANQTIDNSYAGKAILIQGAGTNITLTIADLSTFADNSMLMFLSSGGNHINATIALTGANQFLWMPMKYTAYPSALYLGQSEQLWLIKTTISGTAYLLVLPGTSDTIKMAGEIILTYTKKEINTTFADGTLRNKKDYAKLWAYVQALDPGCLCADADFNATDVNGNYYNNGKFVNVDSNNFRVPNLFTYGTFRNVDGSTRFPSSFEDHDVKSHDHIMHGKGTILGVLTGLFLSKSGGPYGKRFSGGGSDQFGGSTLADTTLRTGDTGGETISKNTGVYALIRC